MLIRPETSEDFEPIANVNRAAFGGDSEAHLIQALRTQDQVICSLVAEDDAGSVEGHILFSPARIVGPDEGRTKEVASLAPMCVAPGRQRMGIGSDLVQEGLRRCRHGGYDAVIVVGHPAYYSRFGFSHALVAKVTNPFAHDEGAFMAKELTEGALSGIRGLVLYPPAFQQLL